MGTIEKYATPGGRQGYIARDSWSDPATGKRQYKKARFPKQASRNLRQCEDEAKAWLAQREADRSRGVRYEPSRELFGVVVDRWANELAVSQRRSASTVAEWRMVARLRFDRIRAMRLCDITQGHIQRLVDAWEGEDKLGPASIQHGFAVMRAVFNGAVARRELHISPLTGVHAPESERRRLVVWTPEEVERFLASSAGDPFRLAWELMLGCLLRIGEVGSLRWEDVRADAGVLQIARTWTRDIDRRRIIGETAKTAMSARVVPVPPHLLTLLDHARTTRAWDDGGWLCAAPGVAAPTPDTKLRSAWYQAIERAGVPRITPHGARHSGASNLIAAGVPVSVVQRILGHTDPALTMRFYVHPADEELDDAISTLSALYRGELTMARAQSAPKVIPMIKNTRRDGTNS